MTGETPMPMRWCLALLIVLIGSTSAVAQTHVAAGGNLQTAIDAAVCGEVITLEAGATFTGNYTLPSKSCTSGTPVTIRTVTSDGTLGTAGITAANRSTFEPLMATIATSNATQALRTLTDASHWRFIGLIFQGTSSQTTLQITQLGDGIISSIGSLPTGFVFTQCMWRMSGTAQAHRGLQMNAADVTVRKSHFYNIRATGVETHSFSAWNSPGPFLIEDNYIESAAIGLIFGGAAPAITGLIPSDIIVRRNTFTRVAAWISDTGYTIKNLLELKNAQRVTIRGNLFEHNWDDGQAGFAIVFTVRANSLSGAPQTTIQDVLFEHNIVRRTGAVFNILGLDNQGCPGACNQSTRMEDVTIRHNLIYEVDRDTWNGPAGGLSSGRFLSIDGAPTRLTVEYNTVQGAVTGSIIFFAGDPLDTFVYQYNIAQKQTVATGFPYNTDGIIGNAQAEGNATLNTYTTSGVVANNVLAGATSSAYNSYGPGNLFPTIATLVADFVDAGNGNFRLVGGSAFAGKGANQDAIEAAIAGTDTGPALIRLRI